MKRYHLQNKSFKERTAANKLVYNKQQNFTEGCTKNIEKILQKFGFKQSYDTKRSWKTI